MKKYFSALATEILKKSDNSPVIYVPNGGNWGDAVIREATLSFFQDHSISYHELPFQNIFWRTYIDNEIIKEYLSDKILVFGGGGAWYPIYHSGYYFVKYYHRFFKHTIVLPSTLVLRVETNDITFFRRDCYESKESYPEALFCHDMAFYLSDSMLSTNSSIGEIGFFFRNDSESLYKHETVTANMDISRLGNEVTPIAPLIKKIGTYDVVHTDRLHVAIIASMLRKKVYFYEGSYFKNEAVFKSSIRDHFENTRFSKTPYYSTLP